MKPRVTASREQARLFWMEAPGREPSSLRMLHIISNKDSSFLSILLKLQGRKILEGVQRVRNDIWKVIVTCQLSMLKRCKRLWGFPF